MTPRLTAKSLLARLLLPDAAPILCASFGRVGSTAVYNAIIRGRAEAAFGSKYFAGRLLSQELVRELRGQHFLGRAVYKTHDLPYDLAIPTPLKVVFLYGRPSDTVLSVVRCHISKGPEWVERHFANCHANGGYSELLQRDVLRMGEQIDAWRAVKGVNVLGLRYERLWENVAVLNAFLGFRIDLPPQRGRNFSDIGPEIAARARENYRALDMKISALPDYFRLMA